MNTLPKICRIWLTLLLLLLITKVYALLASKLPAETSAYPTTAKQTQSKSNKQTNYFLHDPYGPNTYAFGYELNDPQTGNVQFRDERRYRNGSIEGSYGYLRPDGLIEVTRYKADEEAGYMAHSQSFAPDDAVKSNIWPTQLPDLFKYKQHEPTGNWQQQNHLNVSVGDVEQEIAEHLKQEYDLDLNSINVANDVLQPAVLDIVNGKTPLKHEPNGDLGFNTQLLQEVTEDTLPIVPFELPAKELLKGTAKPAAILHEHKAHTKYNKAKSNNDEKSPQVKAAAAEATTWPTPRPLVNSNRPISGKWQQKIIQANRRDFLDHLPNLN